MSYRIALQIDAIESLKPTSDSSLAIGREAQRRGCSLYYYQPKHISLQDSKLTARGHPLALHDDPEHFYDLGGETVLDLSSMDVILLRQDPPFDMAYITNCHMLERLHPDVLVANNPASVRGNPEKWLPLEFADFLPPTLISRDLESMKEFRQEHMNIVAKPLYGFSGNGVFYLQAKEDDEPLRNALAESPDPLVLQRFLPAITDGDTRMMFVDGEYKGALSRIPAKGDFRSGLRTGGTAVKTTLSPRQEAIIAPLSEKLKALDIIFAGIDMIGDYLIEINLTSPTLIPAFNALYNARLERDIWDAVERRLHAKQLSV